MYKKGVVIILWILISSLVKGQFNPANPTTPPINNIPSNQLAQISNDLYNGKINPNMQLMNYEFEGLNFPVSLNYAGSNGIRADEMPTWVGLGWSLQAGGYVHRVVRGKADEGRDFKTRIWDLRNKIYNSPYNYTETELHSTDYSYFSNYNKLAVSNWSTSQYVTSLLPSNSNFAPPIPYEDPTYIGTSTLLNANPCYDLVPDEFSFSVGEVSGKFYLNHENKWIVQANDGRNYDVQVYSSQENLNSYYSAPRIIKYLVLTSDNGIRYYFGNDNSSSFASRLYEYSRSSYSLDPPFQGPFFYFYGPLVDIVPHTWHLSRIENLKTTSIITLDYTSPGYQFYKNHQAWGSGGTYIYQSSQAVYYNGYNPNSYRWASAITKIASKYFVLSSINFPNGVKMKFESSNSSQMTTDESLNFSDATGFNHHIDYAGETGNNVLRKLDKIKLEYSGNVVKTYDFSYIGNDITHRLKLSSISEINSLGEINGKYTFGYNTNDLPKYAWGETDHWGFYNHKDFFLSVSPPYDANNLATFSNYKEPDYNYVMSEILTKITYPTGGRVEFIYEPNKYSKKKNPSDFSITDLNANFEGGGVRIQKIQYYSNLSTLEYEKEFTYQIPGSPNNLSSGVLNSPAPIYVVGTALKSTGLTPHYYSGNPVTFTNITERIVGKGTTKYTYSNYENGHNDGLPITLVTTPFVTEFDYLYKNNAYKRNKLISVEISDENNSPISKVEHLYEHNFNEAGRAELRSIYNKEHNNNQYLYGTVSDLIYSNKIVSSTETTFSAGNSLGKTVSYYYDINGSIKEIKSVDSKGNAFKKRYKYAYEYPVTGTDIISMGINNLLQKKCSSYLIEEIETKEELNGSNVIVLSGTFYVYKTQSPVVDKIYKLQLSNPISYSSFVQSDIQGGSFIKDANYSQQPEVSFDLYDARGNLLQKTSRAGVIESQVWGYNNTYPVASIIGADYNTVYSLISTFQSIIQNPVSDQELADALNSIRAGLAGTNAQVMISTYSPLIGVTRKIDTNNHTTYYEYDGFGRISKILDENHNIIKAYEYHFKN